MATSGIRDRLLFGKLPIAAMRLPLQLLAALFLSIFFVVPVNPAKMVSFTANGRWGTQTAISNDTLCQQKFMCTPNNWTWIPSYPVPPFLGGLYDNETACAALISKGITNIYFHGDSFMRQIYAAMMITLTGDYQGGSLANATRVPECANHQQFNEKRCSTRELNHYGRVCGGKVILDPLLTGFTDLSICGSSNGSVVLWSFGNYKVTKNGRYPFVRYGVNNASAYAEFFEEGICKRLNTESYINQTRHSPLPIAQVGSKTSTLLLSLSLVAFSVSFTLICSSSPAIANCSANLSDYFTLCFLSYFSHISCTLSFDC